MKPSNFVKVIAAVLFLVVFVICAMTYTNEEEIEMVYNEYLHTTQDFNRTKVTTIITQLHQEQESASINGGSGQANPNIPGVPQVNATTWLNVCDQVHKAWGKSGFTYGYGRGATYTDHTGAQYNVRLDCSGYVGFCMYTAGFAEATTPISSGSNLTKFGFTLVPKTGGSYTEADLQPGDVLAYNGHIEVWAGDGKIYNWGSTASTSDLYANGAVPDKSTVNLSRNTNTLVSVFRPPAMSGSAANLPENELTVFVDAGHGCNNTSGSADGRAWGTAESRSPISVGNYSGDEHTWALTYVNELKAAFEAQGFTVRTIYDYGRTYANTGNSGRAKIFNDSDACVMIQVHWNALGYTAQSRASGFLCCIDSSSPRAADIVALADCIKPAVDGKPLAASPHYDRELAVMNNAKKPVALVECGFADNVNDRAALEDPSQRALQQQGIVEGVINYLSSN